MMEEQKILYRFAAAGDAAVLTEMRLEMRRERETVALPEPESAFAARTRAYFDAALLDKETFLLLAFGGEAAAACAALTIHTHAPSYGNLSGKSGYLFNIYTRPAWRKRGIAVEMLRLLAARAQECGCSALELNASPAGRGLYLRCGFTELGGEMVLPLPARF